MVERCETTGEIVRLIVGGRCGRDEPKVAGRPGDRRKDDSGIHGAQVRALEILLVDRERVGQEDRVQAPGFGMPRDLQVIVDVGIGEGIAVAIAPGADMHSEPKHPHVEDQAAVLAVHAAAARMCAAHGVPSRLLSLRHRAA